MKHKPQTASVKQTRKPALLQTRPRFSKRVCRVCAPASDSSGIQPRLKTQAGFTLVEVIVILSILAILSIMIVPQIRSFVHSAQEVRARGDLQAICTSLMQILRDVGPQALRIKGKPGEDADAFVAVLVSSGDIPEMGPNGDGRWLRPVNGTEVDFLDNYLVTNTPGGDGGRRFPTPRDGAHKFAWRGSYTTGPLHSDPWGNRYMINVQFLSDGRDEDVVIFSAGPDEKVETDFARDGLFPGRDDLIFLCARDSGGKGHKS